MLRCSRRGNDTRLSSQVSTELEEDLRMGFVLLAGWRTPPAPVRPGNIGEADQVRCAAPRRTPHLTTHAQTSRQDSKLESSHSVGRQAGTRRYQALRQLCMGRAHVKCDAHDRKYGAETKWSRTGGSSSPEQHRRCLVGKRRGVSAKIEGSDLHAAEQDDGGEWASKSRTMGARLGMDREG